MYRQLLLSTGGGILSNNQKDKQAQCATLLIGLGGTGGDCLKNLKQQVYSRLQADDPNAVVPTYSHIKFLAIDADKNTLKGEKDKEKGKKNKDNIYPLDEMTEFFDISSSNIETLLIKTKELSGKPECKWLKTTNPETGEQGLKILSATAGAGGVRQVGRLLLMQKSNELVNKIQNLIQEAKRGFPEQVDVNVHIFSGMGGGSGSGTFLDVCYLVQRALENIGEDGHALTCGYFFLPDVNLSVPEVAAKNDISSYIMANGFAAMKELDYCMNLETNGGSWDQEYRGFHIGPVRRPPVKCCHLISAHATNGATLNKGYEYAMNVVGDFVLQFLVDNDINMQSHISNYYASMQQVSKECGANYQYILLGASNAVVPMREITTYLASRLFESMSQVQTQFPTNGAIEDFAKSNELTYEQLLKLLLDKTSYHMPVMELDEKLFRDMSEGDLGNNDTLILPETVLQPYRSLQAKMAGQVETNMQALLHPWEKGKLKEKQNSISRVWRTYGALSDIVSNPEYGPFYAAAMLNGSGRKNLVDGLKGVLETVQTKLKQCRGDLSLRIKEVKQARHAFLHPGLLKDRKKLFRTFIASVARYMSDTCFIDVLSKMEGMLRKMTEQFTNLYKDCFEPYAQVNQELMETFHENYQIISSDSVSASLEDPFVMPIFKMDKNMRETLDKAVESMDMAQETTRLQSAMFSDMDVWVTKEEAKIVKFISDYIVNAFAVYTQKTITNYLQMYFRTNKPEEVAAKTHTEILRPLSMKATPLFWKKSNYNPVQGNLGYCSIPDEAAEIIHAAERLLTSNPDLRLVKSKFANRIFMLRCLCGVPMFAYNGVQVYCQRYMSDTSVGKHLYEYTSQDSRDWRTLSNLQPYSIIENPSSEMLAKEQEYEQAIKRELVRINPLTGVDYQLVQYSGIEELEKSAKKAEASRDDAEIQKVKAEIQEYRMERKPIKYFAIPNDGARGHEEKVRKDHVMDSKVLTDVIHEELEKLNRLDAWDKKMNEILEEEEQKRRNKMEEEEQKRRNKMEQETKQEQFRTAVYTGVFSYVLPKVIYTKVKFGMTKDIILSDIKTEPLGKMVPLYQAYLTYQAMPEKEQKEIADECTNRLDDLQEWGKKISETMTALETTFSDRYMNTMQNQAKRVPDMTEEIEEFLLDFRQGMEEFRMMYGIV